jgi:hydrogenase maturation protein HypF
VHTVKRIQVTIEGIVQGVGFRPFIYRLANECGLTGWVMNTPSGVLLEAQGPQQRIAEFLPGIEQNAPPLAVISAVRVEEVSLSEESGFVIRQSGGGRGRGADCP